MKLTNWVRDDTLAEEIIDRENVKGWYNETADEAVVRSSDNGVYTARWYTRPERSRNSYQSQNGRILFRDSVKRSIDSRIVDILRTYSDGLDWEGIRRSEIDSPQALDEWAHTFGAKNSITEKIGNCKDSGGEVAIFEGSSRRGRGAYVAVAYESGPRGKDYFSVGTEMNGFYDVELSGVSNPRRGAIEIIDPSNIEFMSDGEIVVTGDNGKEIRVIPTEKGQRTEAWKDV